MPVVCIQNKTYFLKLSKANERKKSLLDISAPKIDAIWLDDVTVQSKFLKYYLKCCVLSVIIIKAVYIGKWKEKYGNNSWRYANEAEPYGNPAKAKSTN